MHGTHNVTLTHCNMMHGTHNFTLTHCNMMHGTHNVTLTHCNMMHGVHNVKLIPISSFRGNMNYLLPWHTPRPNIRQAFIRRYTFLSILGTSETFLFIFLQGRGVAKGGGGKGCGRPCRQSLRGTKINIKKKTFVLRLTNFILLSNITRNSLSAGEFFEVGDSCKGWTLWFLAPWRHKTELRHNRKAIAA